MAICKYCQLEMNEADGCVKMLVRTIDGQLDPIPYGSETKFAEEPPAPGQHHHGVLIGDPPRCHDCAALPGHYHHSGCDYEDCPRCGEQLIGCDCDPHVLVHVRLLNEGTNVVRPISALRLGDGLYELLPTKDYDAADETSDFSQAVRSESSKPR